VRGVIVAILVALSAVPLATAGPASADANDQNYLSTLAANGLGCGQGAFQCDRGDDDMIQIGRSICRQMHGGNSKLSLAQSIMRAKPAVSSTQAVILVSAAEAAYCP
jgi:hypothetical protein